MKTSGRLGFLACGLALCGSLGCTEAEDDTATFGLNPVATDTVGDTSSSDSEVSSDSAPNETQASSNDDSSTGDSSTGDTSTESSGSETDTSGTPSGCQDADILCEDFEGGLPSGGSWLDTTCWDSNYQISVSEGALLTSGASSSANNGCPLHYDLGVLESFWVTAHVRIVGNEPGMEHEVTFFELGAQPDADDPELRIGYRGDSSCNNNGAIYAGLELGATQGPGGEYTGCTGLVPPAETWLCLEVSVEQSGDSLEADMYLDGEPLDYLVHSMPQTTVLGNFSTRYLKVGMQSYSGAFDGLLIDDLSVSSTRVACGD